MSFPQNTGSFVPVSNVWDVGQISDLNIDPALKELLVRLYQNINLISINLNIKDTGYYPLNDFVNGQLFFPNPTATPSPSMPATYRQVFRKVINFGALPSSTTKSVAHKIPVNMAFTFTRIYGVATDPNTKFIPLPYSSTASINDNIELWVDPTYVNVRTAANYSAYTTTYIILEFLKY